MHTKAIHRRPALRYLVAVSFSISFGFFIIALLLHWSSFLFDSIPLALFSLIAFAGILTCATYTSLIGEVKFNRLAITIGSFVGSFVALNTAAQIELLPYRLLVALFATSLLTALATLAFPRPGVFWGESNFLAGAHIAQTLLIIVGIIYSLVFPWAQPILLVLSVSGLLLWSPLLMGGCPMTLFESDLRIARGEKTSIWEEGFVSYYVRRFLKIDLSHGTYNTFIHIVAVSLFLFWIYAFASRYVAL